MLFLADAGGGDQVAPITPLRVLTAWTFEPLPAVALVVAGAAYLWSVHLLHRRGDRWSVWRTLAFCLGGLGSAAVATESALATYDDTLLSVHMAQHMVLSMVTPLFLALGAPVTVALRTLPREPRRWLLAVLHSRVLRVLSFPPVAFAIFVATPWVLYYSAIYPATLRSDALHNLLHLHFVVVGCLFFWPLVGTDPVPGRVAYPFRMLTTFATVPFHAFLGVSIMSMSTLIAGDWYHHLDLDWTTPASDQNLAGGILWAAGDIIGLLFFGVLFAQWVRESQRDAAREDRRLDLLEARERAEAANVDGQVRG